MKLQITIDTMDGSITQELPAINDTPVSGAATLIAAKNESYRVGYQDGGREIARLERENEALRKILLERDNALTSSYNVIDALNAKLVCNDPKACAVRPAVYTIDDIRAAWSNCPVPTSYDDLERELTK